MSTEPIRAASELLLSAWRGGTTIAALPETLRPRTREDGYAIQAELERHDALYGWKIAATSRAGQAHINVDGPIAGRLLRSRIVPDGGTVPAGANRMRVAEVEFAFRMRDDLPPRARPWEVGEVLEAVASVHAAIEIPDSRYDDFTAVGAPQLIADDACAHWFVAGEATGADFRALDLAAFPVVGRIEGGTTTEGRGANALGDPRVALAWLANELSVLGLTLRRGETVTTGTCVTPFAIKPGDAVIADLGVLGSARVTIG